MFREMRRIKNKMDQEDAIKLLTSCDEGVLGTISTNGYPYTVPVNHVYYNDKIYFHSAKEGHKISNIEMNNKVSFTVFDNVKIISETFTTKYQSVVVFGRAKIIPGNKEVLMELIRKYSSSFIKEGKQYVDKSFDTTILVEITIDHLTGKERL
jgi:nitroimidazol reductase NimA-like FMN-containing flavoprotein (pyridoxamine 5'-phosphate oxidase superfamily)